MKKSMLGMKLVILAILLFLVIIWVYPYLWVLIASFKDATDITGTGLLPKKPLTLDHYKFIFITANEIGRTPFLRALINSIFISITVTILVIAISSLAGYALAKHDFRGKRFLNNFVIFQMLFLTQKVFSEAVSSLIASAFLKKSFFCIQSVAGINT